MMHGSINIRVENSVSLFTVIKMLVFSQYVVHCYVLGDCICTVQYSR